MSYTTCIQTQKADISFCLYILLYLFLAIIRNSFLPLNTFIAPLSLAHKLLIVLMLHSSEKFIIYHMKTLLV